MEPVAKISLAVSGSEIEVCKGLPETPITCSFMGYTY